MVFCILSEMSCSNKQDIQKELKLLTSKPIILPKNSIVISSKDNPDINSHNQCDLKLIIYTAPQNCSSCGINNIHIWEKYLEYAQLFNGRLKLYFIYAPKKSEVNKIKLALGNNPLDYPVFIDDIGEFERMNIHLPKNKELHTFLLDKNNNVIMVGNPLQSKSIEHLFYKTVKNKLGDIKYVD